MKFYKLEAFPKGGIYASYYVQSDFSIPTELRNKYAERVELCRSIMIDWLDDYGRLSNENHPEPCCDDQLAKQCREDDADRFCTEDYVYGFDSIKQLRRWFYSDEPLSRMGEEAQVELAIYDVPKVYVGHTQSAVNKSHFEMANPIKRIPLQDFVKDPSLAEVS